MMPMDWEVALARAADQTAFLMARHRASVKLSAAALADSEEALARSRHVLADSAGMVDHDALRVGRPPPLRGETGVVASTLSPSGERP